MSKRPGSLVLTFSRKNADVRNLIECKKEETTFIVTDYICESIRFYEKHKNSGEFHDLNTVKNLIDERLKAFVFTSNTLAIGLAEEKIPPKEKIDSNTTTGTLSFKENLSMLEMDLDGVSIEED